MFWRKTSAVAGELTKAQWLKSQIDAEPYWFHRMELPDGLVTPGGIIRKRRNSPTSLCRLT